MLLNLVLVIAGLVILTLAADWLVEGASALAHRIGVSPLLIGLTIVAAGTSAPELVVSVQASFENNPGICVGNAVGSNIFNAAAILGIAALIHPIAVSRAVIWRDVPVMIGSALLAWFMARDRLFSRPESALLLFLLVLYTGASYWQARKKPDENPLPHIPAPNELLEDLTQGGTESAPAQADGSSETPAPAKPSTIGRELGLIAVGLIAMIAGSKMLLVGAVAFAKYFGLSDEVIGLTLIAAGTSLPELATSTMAAWKGESEIAIGNVVGSNIFNILGILGFAGTLLPLQVSEHMFGIDIPIMVVVSLGVLPIMRTGMKISRPEGIILLGTFIVYTWYLFQTQ